MIRSCTLAMAVCGLVLASVRAEEPAYTLKLKESGKGNVAIVLVKHEFTGRAKLLTNPEAKDDAQPRVVEELRQAADPRPQRLNMVRGEMVLLYEETVLAVENGQRPTRLLRRYEQAMRKKEGQKTTLPYEWKTVAIEKKEDKYRFLTDEGKELTGEGARLLEEEFGKEPSPWDANHLLLPAKPVRVGDSWTIATGPFVKNLEAAKLKVDDAKSTAKGKLLRVYDKGGARFGVIECRLELMVTPPGEGGPWRMVVDVTLDACIDGSNGDFLRTDKSRLAGEGIQVEGEERVPALGVGESSRQIYRRELKK